MESDWERTSHIKEDCVQITPNNWRKETANISIHPVSIKNDHRELYKDKKHETAAITKLKSQTLLLKCR